MKRLCVLVCLLVACGCMSDDEMHRKFDSAFKDAQGENMRMRGDMSALDDSKDAPTLRPRGW